MDIVESKFDNCYKRLLNVSLINFVFFSVLMMYSTRLRVISPFLLCTIILFILIKPTTSLYFYLEGTEQKCFLEELPRDTLVVGKKQIIAVFSM
jgi:hypothetical protein